MTLVSDATTADMTSAQRLFGEKHCDTPLCAAMVPNGARLCRSCTIEERRLNGGSGAGRPPRGRFEARVSRVMQIAATLDQAEADHRASGSSESHTRLRAAFSDYVRAVALLARG